MVFSNVHSIAKTGAEQGSREGAVLGLTTQGVTGSILRVLPWMAMTPSFPSVKARRDIFSSERPHQLTKEQWIPSGRAQCGESQKGWLLLLPTEAARWYGT